MNKKILYISYVFPPTGGAGIQRTIKLVKYFARLGWEPFVLTAKNPSVPVFDFEMLKDIPGEIKIYKSFSLEIPYSLKRRLWRGTAKPNETSPSSKKSLLNSSKKRILAIIKFFIHLIMLPDPQIGWNYFAVRKAKKIIKKHQIGFVFISAPPFSSLLMSSRLSRIGVKVVADFRDEWTEFYLKSYDFHQRDEYTSNKIIRMEKEVIDNSNLITMATESFVKNYQQKYNAHASKIKLLTNGYDPEDFDPKMNAPEVNEKFNITYTGTIFNVTTARFLLDALAKLINENEHLTEKIRVNIVGRITDEEKIYFDDFRHSQILNLTGYVSHEQSVNYLNNSNLLVVIVDDLEGSERIIAAKVFEYIYSGVPILALVPENGEIARIVQKTQTGIVVSNRDVKRMSETLLKFINQEIEFKRNQSEIALYSRENIAVQLTKYLMEL